MASVRSAILPRLRLLRRGLCALSPSPARRAPPALPPRALLAVSAGIRVPAGARGLAGGAAGHDGSAGEPEDTGETEEAGEPEDAELLHPDQALFPVGAQRVFLLHPDFRGPGGRTAGDAENHVAEATALVRALPGWTVTRTLVAPAGKHGCAIGGRVFGRGSFQALTEKIRACPDVTCVFLDVEKMAAQTQKELETAWGVPVLDRFTVVLRVFRCHARTREARLQLALAEIPLLRSTVHTGSVRQEGRGSRYIMGSGESPTELRHRALREKEAKITHALRRLRERRGVLRRGRQGLPVVAVVGYTNCGKTTLIKALTGDPALRPRDQPFSTLDVTAHAGWLPSRVPVLYVDTVGFLSRLPHGLVHAFATTLEDVAHADVILHVRDANHPDTERHKDTVLSALRDLRLPHSLLESVLEVHNKADLAPGSCPQGPGALAVSALLGQGLEELKAALEAAVLRATGARVLTVRVPLGGPELGWLHREASVQHVREAPNGDAGSAHVTVVIARAALGRFRKLFPGRQEVDGGGPAPGTATDSSREGLMAGSPAPSCQAD